MSELRQYFTSLPPRLTPKVPFMNIIMVGGTGSGKSTFLKTFTTALNKRNTVCDVYRASPSEGREYSATKRVRYNKFTLLNCNNLNILKIHNLDFKSKNYAQNFFNKHQYSTKISHWK